jgi:hypothetical protein
MLSVGWSVGDGGNRLDFRKLGNWWTRSATASSGRAALLLLDFIDDHSVGVRHIDRCLMLCLGVCLLGRCEVALGMKLKVLQLQVRSSAVSIWPY